MKILSVLSQKGGAGKTTLSVHLAVAAEQKKKSTVLIDLDPQITATEWAESREAETPIVVSCQAKLLDKYLKTAEENGADLAIIDTAPHSERDALAAARAADYVLIPCRPEIFDLRAITHTIDMVRLTRIPAGVVLNAAPYRGRMPEDAAEVVEELGMPLAPVTVVQRAAYRNALPLGLTVLEYEPKGKAADEIWTLHRWVTKQLR